MNDIFIEKETSYDITCGKLSVYETNSICSGIEFVFDEFTVTTMLSGHKTVKIDNMNLEFFPGTILIPPRNILHTIDIPNASKHNKTECLVLTIDGSYINKMREEIISLPHDFKKISNNKGDGRNKHFLSNDTFLIEAMKRLYKLEKNDHSSVKPLIEQLIIKEILYRLYITDASFLMHDELESSYECEEMRKIISYIRQNIGEKHNIQSLSKISGLGQTNLNKLFKKTTNMTPIEFVLHERIRQACIMLNSGKLELKEIASRTGFNSYEYFCSCFKKIVTKRPSEYRESSNKPELYHMTAT